jgi:cellobiose phosphorylase
MQNPEIEGMKILLQEKIPETFITTKEMKEKIEKIRYKDYENYTEQTITKIDSLIIRSNVISNENYTIAINQKGQGFSKYKDIYINRFKPTADEKQGIFFYIKNIKTNKIWSSNYCNIEVNNSISFMPDKIEQETTVDGIKIKLKTTVSPKDEVEIRRAELENTGNEEQILEVVSYFEPVLSQKEQDYAHPAFNNLFLVSEYDEKTKALIIKRKARVPKQKAIYLATKMSTNSECIGDTEYEIDKEKFIRKGKSWYSKHDKIFFTVFKKSRIIYRNCSGNEKYYKNSSRSKNIC